MYDQDNPSLVADEECSFLFLVQYFFLKQVQSFPQAFLNGQEALPGER